MKMGGITFRSYPNSAKCLLEWYYIRHLSRILVQMVLAEPRGRSSDLDPSLSQLGGLGERCEFPSGVWGRAPAANDFGAF